MDLLSAIGRRLVGLTRGALLSATALTVVILRVITLATQIHNLVPLAGLITYPILKFVGSYADNRYSVSVDIYDPENQENSSQPYEIEDESEALAAVVTVPDWIDYSNVTFVEKEGYNVELSAYPDDVRPIGDKVNEIWIEPGVGNFEMILLIKRETDTPAEYQIPIRDKINNHKIGRLTIQIQGMSD
jgi:hypothetical protein